MTPDAVRVALLLASEAVVAGCALALELTLARLMAPMTGMSTDSWVAIIGAFLLSWAMGSSLSGWLASRLSARGMLRACTFALLLAAASAALCPAIVTVADQLLVAADPLSGWRTLVAVSLVCAPAGLLFGLVGPLLMTLLVRWTRSNGLAIGAANMLGALGSGAGALLVPWVLLDALGVRGTLHAIAILAAAVAAALAAASLGTEPGGRTQTVRVRTVGAYDSETASDDAGAEVARTADARTADARAADARAGNTR